MVPSNLNELLGVGTRHPKSWFVSMYRRSPTQHAIKSHNALVLTNDSGRISQSLAGSDYEGLLLGWASCAKENLGSRSWNRSWRRSSRRIRALKTEEKIRTYSGVYPEYQYEYFTIYEYRPMIVEVKFWRYCCICLRETSAPVISVDPVLSHATLDVERWNFEILNCWFEFQNFNTSQNDLQDQQEHLCLSSA